MAETSTRIARLLALVLIVPIGCGLSSASGPPASAKVSCVGVPLEKCDEAVASVGRSLPNTAPVSIEVTCVAGTCTLDSGAMDIVVTLADGSQLRSSTTAWSAGGGPAPDIKPLPVEESIPVIPPPGLPMEPVCVGVPLGMCRKMAEIAFEELSAESVAQLVVSCTATPCTDTQGAGDTLVRYEDGSTSTSSWQYAN